MLGLTYNVPAHQKIVNKCDIQRNREGRIIDQEFKIRQMHKKTVNKLEAAGEAELISRSTLKQYLHRIAINLNGSPAILLHLLPITIYQKKKVIQCKKEEKQCKNEEIERN